MTATTTFATQPDVAAPKVKPHLSDRAKAERRLGLILSAPAVIVMLAVTAYPMVNAIYLSLFNDRLTNPAGREFIGLRTTR